MRWISEDTFANGGRVFKVTGKDGSGHITAQFIGMESDFEPADEAAPVEDEGAPVANEGPAEFVCSYCGRVCGSRIGLSAHEAACKENPANKKGE